MKDTIDTLLKNVGLSHRSSQLKNLTLPSIRILRNATQENMLSLGASKLGGAPDLPQNVAWPTWKGIPLAFAAQINLDEVPIIYENVSLPTSGMLSFFYDADQAAVGYDPASRGGWRVLYHEGEVSRLRRHPIPATLLEKKVPQGHYATCALTFVMEITFPPAYSLSVNALNLSEQEHHAYWDVLDALHETDDQPRHLLGGHPDVLQDDMQIESQLVSHGIYLGDGFPKSELKTKELLNGAEDWQLLLQLDTDQEAEMTWGIEGRCYYWIQAEALQKRHFENVWCIIQWA